MSRSATLRVPRCAPSTGDNIKDFVPARGDRAPQYLCRTDIASAPSVTLRIEPLTLLPTDSPAWAKNLSASTYSQADQCERTIGLPLPHPQSSYGDACSITGQIIPNGTHETSAGSVPSLGFSLLWTTKTPNCVFGCSRSSSGKSCTASSTSFRSSDSAYLTGIHQYDTCVS